MKQLLLTIITLMLCACSTCRISTQNQISEIRFGRGGGFMNQVEQFSLNKKGELSKNGKVIGKASCEDVERIFLIADGIDSPIYEPDNFYWFIEVRGRATHKFLWGGSSQVNRELKNLYNELSSLLK